MKELDQRMALTLGKSFSILKHLISLELDIPEYARRIAEDALREMAELMEYDQVEKEDQHGSST